MDSFTLCYNNVDLDTILARSLYTGLASNFIYCYHPYIITLSVLIFAVQMFRGGCEFAGCKFAVQKSRFSRGFIFAVYLGLFCAKCPKNDEEYIKFTFLFRI